MRCPPGRGCFRGDGNAFFRAIGAGSQIGDRETRGGRGEHSARRGHAIEQPENFQLGLELVGDTIDGEVRIAHGIFNGGDEVNHGKRCRAQLLTQGFARMVQIGRHHVFEQNAIAGARGRESEPAAQRTRSDDGDCDWHEGLT